MDVSTIENKIDEFGLDYEDRLFKNRLIKTVKYIQSGAEDMEKRIAEIEGKTYESEIDRVVDLSDAELEYCSELKTRVCELIGDSAFHELYKKTVPAVDRYIPLLRTLVDRAVESGNEEKKRLESIFETYTRGTK